MNVLNVLVNQFHDVDGLIAQLNEVNQSITNGILRSPRRFELEALQAGQVRKHSPSPPSSSHKKKRRREWKRAIQYSFTLATANILTAELYYSLKILWQLRSIGAQPLRSHLWARRQFRNIKDINTPVSLRSQHFTERSIDHRVRGRSIGLWRSLDRWVRSRSIPRLSNSSIDRRYHGYGNAAPSRPRFRKSRHAATSTQQHHGQFNTDNGDHRHGHKFKPVRK